MRTIGKATSHLWDKTFYRCLNAVLSKWILHWLERSDYFAISDVKSHLHFADPNLEKGRARQRERKLTKPSFITKLTLSPTGNLWCCAVWKLCEHKKSCWLFAEKSKNVFPLLQILKIANMGHSTHVWFNPFTLHHWMMFLLSAHMILIWLV